MVIRYKSHMNDGQYFLLDELNALSCRRQVGSERDKHSRQRMGRERDASRIQGRY